MLLRMLVILLLIFYGCQNLQEEIIIKPLPSNEILFIRNFPLPSFKGFKGELWTMDRDGKNQIKVFEVYCAIGDTCWSPDGKKIAIEYGDKKDVFEIWVVEIEKKKITKRNILKIKDFYGGISWSSDGKKIAFGMNGAVYIIDSNGENLRRIVEGVSPSWSPDGKKIVFQRIIEEKWKVCIVNTDGTNIERLTNSPHSIEEIRPVWSPDGKWIAFQEKEVKKQNKIVLIDLKTKKRRELTPFPKPIGIFYRMCFSPDSEKIAFETLDFRESTKSSQHEIYIVDIDGKNLKNLTNTPDWDESCPSWRPIVKK